MNRRIRTLVCVYVAALAGLSTLSAQSPSIRAEVLRDWASQKDTMMKISDAMPEDKFGFRSTPPQRTFGEQVLHVAEANVAQMGRFGSKATPPTINMKATSKTEILKALADSYDYGTAVIGDQTDETMVQLAQDSRFGRMGPSTRSRVAYFVMGHTWDIYGQMVVYLRLNGIVPPASQRP